VTIRAKTLIQDLWKGGFDWDEKVQENYRKIWTELVTNIDEIYQELTFVRNRPHLKIGFFMFSQKLF
jgi:hypothetical protein